MDSTVLILVLVALFFAFTAESQPIVGPQPRSPSPPLPPPPPPSSVVSPPRPPPSAPYHPPPPPRKPQARPAQEGGNHRLNKHLNPPPVKEKTNMGKKIGLIFVGVASVWQVCIVAFLLISRRRLLKNQNGYQRN